MIHKLQAPINERKVSNSITLPPKLWDFAREVGNGNVSYGIRYILLQAYVKANETKGL